MSKIVEMLRRLSGAKSPPNAADLRSAQADAQQALDAATSTVAKLEAEHRAALLDAPDREVERIESQLAIQRREAARAQAALEELAARARDAESKEASDALDKQLAEAKRAAERAAASLAAEYPPVAGALARMLERADDADRMVREARHAAQVAGRAADGLRAVDELLQPPGVMTFAPVTGSVSLRPMGRFAGYGSARRLFEGAGLVPKVNGSH